MRSFLRWIPICLNIGLTVFATAVVVTFALGYDVIWWRDIYWEWAPVAVAILGVNVLRAAFVEVRGRLWKATLLSGLVGIVIWSAFWDGISRH